MRQNFIEPLLHLQNKDLKEVNVCADVLYIILQLTHFALCWSHTVKNLIQETFAWNFDASFFVQETYKSQKSNGKELLLLPFYGSSGFCLGLPGWGGARKVKPGGKTRLDLLEQEIVSGSGICWAICKSAPHPRQITMPAPTTQVFIGQMPFLPPNQQRQRTQTTKQQIINSQQTSWPITYLNFGHVSASFLHRIEL